MNTETNFNLSVITWFFDNDIDEQPTGVIVQVDNGDTQYLTINDYNNLKNKSDGYKEN